MLVLGLTSLASAQEPPPSQPPISAQAPSWSGYAYPPPPGEERNHRVWDRLLAVNAHLGLPYGGPFGLLGAAIDITPDPLGSFEFGAGFGGSGPQFAVMGRLRPVRGEHTALTLGGSPSTGRYIPFRICIEGCGSKPPVYEHAIWANAEVGLEMRRDNGFTFRVAFGYSAMVNRGLRECGPGRRFSLKTCPTGGEDGSDARDRPRTSAV